MTFYLRNNVHGIFNLVLNIYRQRVVKLIKLCTSYHSSNIANVIHLLHHTKQKTKKFTYIRNTPASKSYTEAKPKTRKMKRRTKINEKLLRKSSLFILLLYRIILFYKDCFWEYTSASS